MKAEAAVYQHVYNPVQGNTVIMPMTGRGRGGGMKRLMIWLMLPTVWQRFCVSIVTTFLPAETARAYLNFKKKKKSVRVE